jgi:predicted nucleic acid-binding protein
MEEALRIRAEAAELEVAAANVTIRELEEHFTELEKSRKAVSGSWRNIYRSGNKEAKPLDSRWLTFSNEQL